MTRVVEGRRSVMKAAPSAAIIKTGKSNPRFGAGHPIHARTAAKPTATTAKTADNDRRGDCVTLLSARFDTMTLNRVGSKGRSRSPRRPQHAAAGGLMRARRDHRFAAGLFRSDTARWHNDADSFEFVVSLEKLFCGRLAPQIRNGTHLSFCGTAHARGTAWICKRIIGSRRASLPLDIVCPLRLLVGEVSRSLATPPR